ncbi:MAG: polyprenyl synthetase family protein [Bdellovibrionales bacterium]|nr:polyprenyl synthetase family protein [Bdellovibrionales bacterium]NQZ18955.1 polyprenyl synthetase family protein [Bdellovibrionales bacterium]
MIKTLKQQIDSHLSEQSLKGSIMSPLYDYHFSSGGKRIRSLLSLMEARHLNVSDDLSLYWAKACELLHNATLVHDDIQDNDPIRRGQPSVWKKFGEAQAINFGDLMIIDSFDQLSHTGEFCASLLKCFSYHAQQLVEGQALEFDLVQQSVKNFWEDYTNVAHWKTGSLLQASVQGIHILAGEGLEESFQKTQSWLQLGLCYQFCDDIRDFLGTKQTEQIQKDFEERRINSIIAQLSTNKENHGLIRDYLEEKSIERRTATLLKINSAVHQQNILEKLYLIVSEHLDSFKNNTSCPEAKKIILNYLSIDFKNSEVHLANTL